MRYSLALARGEAQLRSWATFTEGIELLGLLHDKTGGDDDRQVARRDHSPGSRDLDHAGRRQ
jgi:hypothetical protein